MGTSNRTAPLTPAMHARIAGILGCSSEHLQRRLDHIRMADRRAALSEREVAAICMAASGISQRLIARAVEIPLDLVGRLVREYAIGPGAPERPRPWTRHDDALLLDLWASPSPIADIADSLRRSVSAIYARIADLKHEDQVHVPPRPNGKRAWSDAEVAELLELDQAGRSASAIANRLDRSVGSVRSRLHQARRSAGTTPAHLGFTIDQLCELLEWWGHCTKSEMAARLGCNASTLGKRLAVLRGLGLALPPLRPGPSRPASSLHADLASPLASDHRTDAQVLVAVAQTASSAAAARLLGMRTEAVQRRIARMVNRPASSPSGQLARAAVRARTRRAETLARAAQSARIAVGPASVYPPPPGPRRRAEALRLQQHEGLARAEIAERLGLKPDTVKKMLRRARREAAGTAAGAAQDVPTGRRAGPRPRRLAAAR